MRESVGLTLDENIEQAMIKYMHMHDFLVQGTKFKNKLTTLSNAEEKEIYNYLEARSYISDSMGQINNFDYSTAIQKKQNLYKNYFS